MGLGAGIRPIQQITGIIVDIHERRLFRGTIRIHKATIVGIEEHEEINLAAIPENTSDTFLLPGFVDAHIHVESSMLIPTQFARLAIAHGTVATVSDPHEIANVLGIEGVRFMLRDAERAESLGLTRISFGAPPCVPATAFETAGATVTPDEVRELLKHNRIRYLAEVMNYPGVISSDPDLLAKIAHAKAANKPIDGHAPGLRGQGVGIYFSPATGITTDHECFTLEEALEKLAVPRVKILIREGSAAKNFDALHPLLRTHSDRVMFCSDDKHPHELEEGHLNQVVARAIQLGYDLFDVLRAASVNAVHHYKLPVGLLRVGDRADFIEVANLKSFQVLRAYLDGAVVAEKGRALASRETIAQLERPNCFATRGILPTDLHVSHPDPNATTAHIQLIAVEDGQLITARRTASLSVHNGQLLSNPVSDILKLVVINRYDATTKPAIAFITGFGMRSGAIASSVAHDSHNIVAVGVSDEAIAKAIHLIMREKGGLAVIEGGEGRQEILPLPVAGIMTDGDGYSVAAIYRRMDEIARRLCHQKLHAPFMTLSFMALLVIPSLKLSDRGLFDGESFRFTDLVLS